MSKRRRGTADTGGDRRRASTASAARYIEAASTGRADSARKKSINDAGMARSHLPSGGTTAPGAGRYSQLSGHGQRRPHEEDAPSLRETDVSPTMDQVNQHG